MKTLISAVLLTATLTAQAGTIEEAKALYAARGENPQGTLKASQIYKELADTRSDAKEKAEMKILEAQARGYYTSNVLTDKDQKLDGYVAAYSAADEAVQAMSSAQTSADKTTLAKALYQYSANLGKWGETKGVMSSLGKWPLLKEKSLAIAAADETVSEFGAYRILGKGFIKVPGFAGGDDEKGYAYLKKAYNSTKIEINGIESSTNMANLTYLIWAARELKEVSDFCTYYDNFTLLKDEIDADASLLDQFYPELKPETQTEIQETIDNEDYSDYFAKKC